MVARSRSRDARVGITVTNTVRTYNSSGVLTGTSTGDFTEADIPSHRFTGKYESMTDQVTEHYRKRRNNGEILPVGILSQYTEERNCTDTSLHFRDGVSNPHTETDQFNGPWVHASAYGTAQSITANATMRDIAITRAVANVAKPDALSLVTLAEIGKTRDLIRDSLNGLAHGAYAIGTGRSRKFIEEAFRPSSKSLVSSKEFSGIVFNKLAQKWLEYRYGWMPLYFDIRDHMTALSAKRPKRRTARGVSSDSDDSTTTTPVTIFGVNVDKKVIKHREWLYRAAILYEEETDIRKTINQYGLLALPTVAWELVPFSFVADWFGNLNDCMAAMSPSLGVTYLSCSITEKLFEAVTTDGPVTGFTTAGRVLNGSSNIGTEVFTFTVKNRSAFTPSVNPRITVRLNWKRALDSLALVNFVFGNLKVRI